ncbi:amine oxidase [flavin-containing]-like isoform X2 [Patiria miniata]|nr:amine oxidase [flavin-containing]-like isoform X2 [Patiria miniata]
MVNEARRTISFRNGKAEAFDMKNSVPKSLGIFDLMDLNNAVRLIDAYAKEIPVAAPWDAPRASEWDSMTVQSWLDATCWCQYTKEAITIICRASNASEPCNLSFLFFLWGITVGGGLTRTMSITNGAQERKFVGGAMQISEGLAGKLGKGHVLLNHVVSSVEQSDDGVKVTTQNGDVFEASYMISAVPMTLLGRITFKPRLPSAKIQLIQCMPMGSVIKTFTFYKRNFWKDLDYSGIVFSCDGPISGTYEDCKPDGSHPAIMGFMNGEKARKYSSLTKEERKKVVCEYYAKAFGTDEALHPINYVELNWMDEEFSGGCYMVSLPAGVLTQFGRVMREPLGRVYFAGTETADQWMGYMDGAIQAGERAGREILHQKGLISKDEIWQEEPESLDIPAKPFDDSIVERLLPSVPGFLKLVVTATTLVAAGAIAFFL